MKFKNALLLSIVLLLVVTSSCTETADPLAQYGDWKVRNESYYYNMKDSSGFIQTTIPAERGGGSFYSRIVKDGTGTSSPRYNDSIVVHYQNRNIDWTFLDRTYSGASPNWSLGENPAIFKVNTTLKGFSEAIMLMKVGEKRRIVIPWNMAYGSSGSSGSILPYSTLIFDIELISFSTPKRL